MAEFWREQSGLDRQCKEGLNWGMGIPLGKIVKTKRVYFVLMAFFTLILIGTLIALMFGKPGGELKSALKKMTCNGWYCP